MMRNKKVKLTDVEVQIMNVLWESGKCMTTVQISEKLKDAGISRPSVSQAMKRLLEKDAVKVGDLVLSSNVYARAFQPTFTRHEYIGMEISDLRRLSGKGSGVKGFFAAMFAAEGEDEVSREELEALEQFVREKKKSMRNNEL